MVQARGSKGGNFGRTKMQKLEAVNMENPTITGFAQPSSASFERKCAALKVCK